MSCIDCTQWFPTLLARRMLAGRVGAAAVQDLQPCRAAEPGRGSSLTQGAGAREKVAVLVEAAQRGWRQVKGMFGFTKIEKGRK